MKTFQTTFIFILSTVLTTFLYADEPKRALLTNGELVYNQNPGKVDSITAMISEGELYGRLRSNTFYFDWKDDDSSHNTHVVSGLGASLVYKSARFYDFDFKTALFYSQAFFKDSTNPVSAFKPGKDTLSRFSFANSDDKSMAVLGEAYLRYRGFKETELIIGRQIVETFYTRSNDTKMVPNTFDGIVLKTNALTDTKITLAYLDKQKLRDHEQSHSVLMYGDSNSTSSTKPQWSENDDSAMHRGITYSALKAAGKPTDSPLIVGNFKNKSIDNLKIDTSFYVVPELLSQIMGELNYTLNTGNGISITPGVRYIKQFDNGAGEVGGASYTGDSTGYSNPDSLESQMLAARLVAKVDNYKINLGYSHIFDEADLVTPWRGFPTSGYTRSMARYNWRANTSSYRLELQLNANDTGVYKDVFIQTSVLYTDTDEKKAGYHMQDEMYYYIGFIQNIPSHVNLQWRLRLGYTQYMDSDDSRFDNLDGRFELNYLF